MGETQKERFDLIFEKSGIAARPKREKSRFSKGGSESWYYLGLVGQIGFSIAIPIAGGALLGSFIDRQWGTYPRATLGLLLFGVVISFVTFYQTIQTVLKSTKGKEGTKGKDT